MTAIATWQIVNKDKFEHIDTGEISSDKILNLRIAWLWEKYFYLIPKNVISQSTECIVILLHWNLNVKWNGKVHEVKFEREIKGQIT